MTRPTEGPRSPERLYLNSEGNLTTERGGILVAAAGASIAPEYHDRVTAYLEAKRAGDEQQPAARGEAPEAPAPVKRPKRKR